MSYKFLHFNLTKESNFNFLLPKQIMIKAGSSNHPHKSMQVNSEDEGCSPFQDTLQQLASSSTSHHKSSSPKSHETSRMLQMRTRRKRMNSHPLSYCPLSSSPPSKFISSSPLLNSFKSSLNHNILFVISILLLSLLLSPSAWAAEFNIEKLAEYNSLATCIGQIHKDFEVCNTRGAEKAKSFKVNLGEEWNTRLQCCGMWKLRDCWMRAARAKCSKAQAEQVFKLPHLFLPDLATSCAAFTPESGKCSVPMWLLASVGGAALILVLTCLCGACLCVRKLRARAARRSALHRRHAPKGAGGGAKLGGVSTSLIGSSSVASNGGGGVQLMPSSLANGGSGGGGKAKKGAALNGKLSRPKNGYANGGGGGNARVTINIEEATSDEVKSLNGGAALAVEPSTPVPIAAVV